MLTGHLVRGDPSALHRDTRSELGVSWLENVTHASQHRRKKKKKNAKKQESADLSALPTQRWKSDVESMHTGQISHWLID